MHKVLLGFLVIFTLLFSGCSSRKYFEPEKTFSAKSASTSYGWKIVDLSRHGATLESGQYIGKLGVSSIKISKGYRFLNENHRYLLTANAEGILRIINKKTQKSVHDISLHIPVVSASIKNGIIGYVLNNNTFGVYRISDNSKIVENRSEKTFAIDTRAASPMFIENLIVMPMLDGKLIVIDIYDTENAKVVYISSEKNFNNVIYLSREGNTMVAATPRRVITLGDEGQNEYSANISEVAVYGNKVYLFTKEGTIISLSHALEEVATSKFKFAHFSVGTAFDARVYALDQQGSLIVLNADLSKSKIYKLGKVDEPAFITGKKLYKDGIVIDLSKLRYE